MSRMVTMAVLFVAFSLGAAGIFLILGGVVALFKARPLRFALRTLGGLLLVAVGALGATIALGIQGYRALTHEEVAAQLSIRPTGPQRFSATLRFPDGRAPTYDITGDEVYVDAHILKWKPMANMLGLHTGYELDRIAGRYRSVEQERSATRTVHALAKTRPVDLFTLRQRYPLLSHLVDAEYGSATFVPVSGPAELELRVSTTGLLMRKRGEE